MQRYLLLILVFFLMWSEFADASKKARFEFIAPDAKWGEPFFLYSKTGIPYRCFAQPEDAPMPLACRLADDEEKKSAEKTKPSY